MRNCVTIDNPAMYKFVAFAFCNEFNEVDCRWKKGILFSGYTGMEWAT